MDSKINSKEYWDKRFASGDWENKGGNQQTKYFYSLLLENLPEHIQKLFDRDSLSICDVGCAEGDGTKLLQDTFVSSNIFGVDISDAAIEKANRNYKDITFLTNLDTKYDVVISSNTLEHFESPSEHLKTLFKYADKFVVILVPFEEYERIDEHFFTFTYDYFNLQYKDFLLCYMDEIEANKTVWNGKQLLLVFQKNVSYDKETLESIGMASVLKRRENTIIENTKEIIKQKEVISQKELELSEVINQKELELSAVVDQKELELSELRAFNTMHEQTILNQYHQLNAIYKSKLWRYGGKLYALKDKHIIRYLFSGLRSIKDKGLVETFKTIQTKIDTKLVSGKLQKHSRTSNYSFSKIIEDKNAKKVSIILPVYNQSDMIDESIESVLSQTYQDFELIIINDGSTDGIEDVLKKYEDDARILILNQKNQKLPIALNNGFHFATGNYFTWTSADNIMLPKQLEVLVEYLEKNPTKGMVYSNYQVINDEGNPLNDSSFRPQNQDKNDLNIMRLPGDITFENLHDSGDNYIGASFMYRKSVAMSVGKYTNDTFGGEDYDYWLRIHNLYPIGFVKDVLYKYRVHENTLNSKAKELNLFENIQRLLKRDKQRRLFLTKNPEFVQMSLDFELPNEKSNDKVFLFNTKELTEMDFYNDRYLTVLLIDSIQNIDFQILTKLDFIVCPDEFIYRYLDAKEDFKYKLLYLNLNKENDKKLFVKIATNRLFDKQNIKEKIEVLPDYVLNKKIHIAFVLDSFDKGGLEKVVYNLVVKLNLAKFKITVLITGNEKGVLGSKLQEHGFNVKIMNNNLKLFQETIVDESFNLVNYHYTLFGIDICVEHQIPTIYTVHNTYVWLNDGEYIDRYKKYKKIDRFVCVSDNVMKYFINKFQIINPSIDMIPNGFNVLDFNASENFTREELNLEKDDFIFINLASINGSKMQMLIINAMKELKKEYSKFKILFVGNILDQKYHIEVMDKIKQNDLEDNIIFLDYVSTEMVGSLLNLSDCFLLPSLYEGWSNAIMEAMYCELPLIVTRVGSSDNLISNGDIGIVIDNATDDLAKLNSEEIFKLSYSDTFKNQIVLENAMIDMYTHRDKWKEKAKLGKNKILDFYTLDIMAEKYENLFLNSYFHLKS